MKTGSTGGGRTITGLRFESRLTLEKALEKLPGYSVSDDAVYCKGQKVAELYQKHKLYKKLLEPNKIDYSDIISKKLLPDDAIFVLKNKILYIIKIKMASSKI